MTPLRIATRNSPLAQWQAQYVKAKLLQLQPDLSINIIGFTTDGDQHTGPLQNNGGKTSFVTALQQAILNNQADCAVHSIKDLSVHDQEDLSLVAILQREDPRDVLLSPIALTLDQLPADAVIGTASPRREALLKHHYPALHTALLRGNINTRLKKLHAGDYDAIILAAAGLIRLGLTEHIASYLPSEQFIPAIGQGALGIECRTDDPHVSSLLQQLNHPKTAICVTAERAVNRYIGGDCHTPIAAHAVFSDQSADQLVIQGFYDNPSHHKPPAIISIHGNSDAPSALGEELGKKLAPLA